MEYFIYLIMMRFMARIVKRENKSYYYVNGRRSVKVADVVFVDCSGTEYYMGHCVHRFVDLDINGSPHYADSNKLIMKVSDDEVREDGWYIVKEFNGKTRHFYPERIVRRPRDVTISSPVRNPEYEWENECHISGEGVNLTVDIDNISVDRVKTTGKYTWTSSHSVSSIDGGGFRVGEAELNEYKGRMTGHSAVRFLSFNIADIKNFISDDVIDDISIINSEEKHRITVADMEGKPSFAIYYETCSNDRAYEWFRMAFHKVFRKEYSPVEEKHVKYLTLINSLIADGVIRKM